MVLKKGFDKFMKYYLDTIAEWNLRVQGNDTSERQMLGTDNRLWLSHPHHACA